MDILGGDEFVAFDDGEDTFVSLPQNWFSRPRAVGSVLEKDSEHRSSPRGGRRGAATLWLNWDEFDSVHHNLFHHFCVSGELAPEWMDSGRLFSSDSVLNLQHGVDVVEMWRSRDPQRLSVCIDVTQQLMAALYLFGGSKQALRRVMASCISRITNRLLDQATSRRSTLEMARSLDFPFPILSLRHDIVHEALPSLPVLRQHSLYLLRWLHSKFWRFEKDKVEAVCHRATVRRLSNLQRAPWNEDSAPRRAVEAVTEHLKERMAGGHIAVMRYVLPFVVEHCLLDLSCLDSLDNPNALKPAVLDLGSKEVVERAFTALFVRYSPLLSRLIATSFVVLPHLIMLLLQRRHSMLCALSMPRHHHHHHDDLKSKLLVIWCSSLLTEGRYSGQWKQRLSRPQIVFCIENMVKFVVPFSDALSREMLRNLKQFAKGMRCDGDIAILDDAKLLQKLVEPLPTELLVDGDIGDALSDRAAAEERCRALMEKGIITKLKEEEEADSDSDGDDNDDGDGDELEDSDLDEDEHGDGDGEEDDAESESDAEMEERTECKWELSSDCKFLPIGHSVLPPLRM